VGPSRASLAAGCGACRELGAADAGRGAAATGGASPEKPAPRLFLPLLLSLGGQLGLSFGFLLLPLGGSLRLLFGPFGHHRSLFGPPGRFLFLLAPAALLALASTKLAAARALLLLGSPVLLCGRSHGLRLRFPLRHLLSRLLLVKPALLLLAQLPLPNLGGATFLALALAFLALALAKLAPARSLLPGLLVRLALLL